MFDIEIAAYLLDSTKNKYELKDLAEENLKIDLNNFFDSKEEVQLSLLNDVETNSDENLCKSLYLIQRLYLDLKEKLQKNEQYELFTRN